jgi:hypothetical protein
VSENDKTMRLNNNPGRDERNAKYDI